jgi:hypothetical protein
MTTFGFFPGFKNSFGVISWSEVEWGWFLALAMNKSSDILPAISTYDYSIQLQYKLKPSDPQLFTSKVEREFRKIIEELLFSKIVRSLFFKERTERSPMAAQDLAYFLSTKRI